MIEKEVIGKQAKAPTRGKKGKTDRAATTIQNTLLVAANDAPEQHEREVSETPVLESNNIVYEQMDYY